MKECLGLGFIHIIFQHKKWKASKNATILKKTKLWEQEHDHLNRCQYHKFCNYIYIHVYVVKVVNNVKILQSREKIHVFFKKMEQ